MKVINQELENAPSGSLKIQRRGNKIYYYHQVKREGTYVKKYIEQKNKGFAIALAKKGYYEKVKPLLEKELDALETFEKSYDENMVNDLYDSMIEARKQMVDPVRMSAGEILKKWETEVYEMNHNYQENLIYRTDHGENVRSKSELIIANMLNRYSEHLRYKYERPLELTIYGEKRIIHPDFTVLNIHTGKMTYWEHVGMMDEPNYASGFVRKVNSYMENGIVPGKDLLFTFETSDCPINTQNVLVLIESML